jgi:hypothetical protein
MLNRYPSFITQRRNHMPRTKSTTTTTTATPATTRRTRKPVAAEVVQNGTPFTQSLIGRLESVGLNKNKLAIRAGLSPANVHGIFNGKIAMSPKAATFIAPVLGTTALELLTEQLVASVADVQSNLSAEEKARLTFINAVS